METYDWIEIQKPNSFECGSIAILNFLNFYKLKHNYSVKKLNKLLEIDKKDYSSVNGITSILDKQMDYPVQRIANPSFKDIKRNYQGMAIILFYDKERVDNHFSNILKITDKYIYLSNLYDTNLDEVVKYQKFNIKDFFKNNEVFWFLG